VITYTILEADATPELEADEAFETFASEAPSGAEALSTKQSDIDIVSRI